jgi:hypothetical protein
MSTNIYQFNNNLLVTVADGTLNNTAAPIAFPGKGYSNYGAPVLQDVLWVMQNFAGAATPTPALQGMCWYNTSINQLQIYTGTVWTSMFKANQSNIPDTTLTYDLGSSSFKFNNIWSGTVNATTGNVTTVNSTLITATTGNVTTVNATTVNVVGTVTAANFVGDATLYRTTQNNAPTSDSLYNLGSSSFKYAAVYATTFNGDTTLYRTTQTNLPASDNLYNLGSASFKYANVYATTFNGVATSAQYADVAERYEADAELEVGDVVIIGGEKEVTKSTVDADNRVFGVISDKPALKMNDKAGTDKTHPLVALLGRTPCKVVGPVGKGQRLVASNIPGVARAADGGENPWSILGRSLQAKTTVGVELVEIVIGRS